MSQKVPLKLNTRINWNKNQRTFSSDVEAELELMVAEDDSTLFDNSKILKKIQSSKKRKASGRSYKRRKYAEGARIPGESAEKCILM